MNVSDELVRKVLKMGLTPDEEADLLRTYGQIRDRAVIRDRAIAQIEEASRKKIASLREQKFCNHEITKYHGDPSGGSDSHEECLICGDCIYDKPYRRS
jgi:hypothetical protein